MIVFIISNLIKKNSSDTQFVISFQNWPAYNLIIFNSEQLKFEYVHLLFIFLL